MNLEEFNKNFPSYENKLILEKEKESLRYNEFMKSEFLKNFPNQDFRCLQSQNARIRTNDSCIHFKYEETNDIYSWNYNTNMWIKVNKKQQEQLMDLFDTINPINKYSNTFKIPKTSNNSHNLGNTNNK